MALSRLSERLVCHDEAVAAIEFVGVAQVAVSGIPDTGLEVCGELLQAALELGRLQPLETRHSRADRGI